MPNPSRSGIRGNPWHNCARCGLSYRVSELTWQEGLLLCQRTCWDSQTASARDIQISRIMSEIALYPDAQVDPKLTNPDQISPEEL